MGVRILRTSSSLPSKIVSNSDFEKYLDTSDEWIKSRTGIESRYFLSEDESLLGLIKNSVDKLNLTEEEKGNIKMILVASCTVPSQMPNLASKVHHHLNLGDSVFSLDINMACSGYVAGLNMIEKYISEGEYALLIGAEEFSKLMDLNDRNTAVLFGDGVGSSLIAHSDLKSLFTGGTIGDLDALTFNQDDKITMDGRKVYRFAVEVVPEKMKEFLEANNIDILDIDYIFCHQANIRILKSMANSLKVSMDVFPHNLESFGNTSSASIPLLLSEYDHLIKDGDKTLFVGFGAGLTWSISYIEW